MSPRGRARQRTYKVGDLEIVEPPELTATRKAIQDVLQLDVGFDAEPLAKGVIRFILTGPGAVRFQSEDWYFALPLIELDARKYWLAVEVQCTSRAGELDFSGASILVFRGTLAE